jgi:hypothetical protein
MQIEIIGYERDETRKVSPVWSKDATHIESLVPSKRIRVRRYLNLRFPDGSVEKVRASKRALEKFLASR